MRVWVCACYVHLCVWEGRGGERTGWHSLWGGFGGAGERHMAVNSHCQCGSALCVCVEKDGGEGEGGDGRQLQTHHHSVWGGCGEEEGGRQVVVNRITVSVVLLQPGIPCPQSTLIVQPAGGEAVTCLQSTRNILFCLRFVLSQCMSSLCSVFTLVCLHFGLSSLWSDCLHFDLSSLCSV